MVRELFYSFKNHFNYFFEDDDYGFEAGNEFISDFLSNLYSQQFMPETPLVQPGEAINELYMIQEGIVIV